MKYNFHKHIELLKYQDSLIKNNKNLKEENKSKYLELLDYSLQLNSYLHWSRKSEYIRIIEDFLNFKIDGEEFRIEFCDLLREIEKKFIALEQNYETIKNIELSSNLSNLKGFAKWISEIYLCCDEFYPDYDERNPPTFKYAKSEKDLRIVVSDILLELQKY